jgi:hypothetical protein
MVSMNGMPKNRRGCLLAREFQLLNALGVGLYGFEENVGMYLMKEVLLCLRTLQKIQNKQKIY